MNLTKEHPNRTPDQSEAVLVILSEDLSANDLADAVGLSPDRSWNRGDMMRVGRPRRAYHGVEFRSRLDPAMDPDDHLADLLARVSPHRDQLKKLAARLNASSQRKDLVRVWVTHLTSNGMPGYDFSPDQLRQVNDLGAYLGISIDFNIECPEPESLPSSNT